LEVTLKQEIFPFIPGKISFAYLENMHLAGSGALFWRRTHDVNDDVVVHFLK